MKKSRFTEQQIAMILKQVDDGLGVDDRMMCHMRLTALHGKARSRHRNDVETEIWDVRYSGFSVINRIAVLLSP